ncbi:MAG: hypothetical protein QG653_527 [Patescibacteria group bacterium]|nr:hypothetical protein [Patescibacteria group bacterium]
MQEDIKQDYGTLIAKKSERLVTALYLVTDLMDETEPIKRSLRSNAVSLLSSMNSLAQREVKDKVTEFKKSLRALTEIISLLHVSITTGLVSDMNGNILMDGFRSLQLVLEKKQPILTKDMLTVEHESSLSNEGVLSSAITSSSYDAITPLSLARTQQTKDTSHKEKDSFSQQKQMGTNKGQQEEKDKIYSKSAVTPSSATEERDSLPTTSFQMKKQNRRDQILSLFVKGVDVSIKDIASRIKGCSEKTIQRELNNLLYSGIIERIGEKRWSRYILK